MKMRRATPILVAAAIAWFVGVPLAQADPGGRGRATLTACVNSTDPSGRSMTVRGSAAIYAAGQTMAVRFDLLSRTSAGGPERTVEGGGMGTWTRSSAGVTSYERFLTIQNLPAPAVYRAALSFQWIDKKGKVVRTAVVYTPTCTQVDLRPDLVAKSIRLVKGGKSGTWTHEISVSNSGKAPAPNFDLLFSANGLGLPAQDMMGIGVGGSRKLRITAPACTSASSTVSVTVDPANRIAESNENNNVLTVACPSNSSK